MVCLERCVAVRFKIFKGFPPDEEGPIAEVVEQVQEGVVNTPAIIRFANGEIEITIYDRAGNVAWEYPLTAFCDALGEARSVLSKSQS